MLTRFGDPSSTIRAAQALFRVDGLIECRTFPVTAVTAMPTTINNGFMGVPPS
jgi:hypothetical protein